MNSETMVALAYEKCESMQIPMDMPIEWGVVLRALDGYKESGDQYVVKAIPQGALVVGIDGLGHGDKAAVAAKAAVAVVNEYAHEPLVPLVKRCHKALIGTRGAVMSLAIFDKRDNALTWIGIGNVNGVLLRANGGGDSKREVLLLRGGTVGYRIPTLRTDTRRVCDGDTLIFVSDGVRSGFANDVDLNHSPQEIADRIFAEYGRGTDDTLVLVARYKSETECE